MKERKLSDWLPEARARFMPRTITKNGVEKEWPHEIQLREMPNGECQVIRYWHLSFENELKGLPYESGAYVIARARSWKELFK